LNLPNLESSIEIVERVLDQSAVSVVKFGKIILLVMAQNLT